MEQNRENQVWQRVMKQPEERPASDLQGLIRESAELAGIYRRMGEKLSGRGQYLARQLQETEQANLDRLRGIAAMSGEKKEVLKHWEPAGSSGIRILTSCYHRSLRCRAEYTARCLDPQYGEIYRSLADRMGQQCGRIAELLGRMQKG